MTGKPIEPFEPNDAEVYSPGFGKGGVPWLLLLLYLSFLGFFTWYTMEFQLPEFLNEGPGQVDEAPE